MIVLDWYLVLGGISSLTVSEFTIYHIVIADIFDNQSNFLFKYICIDGYYFVRISQSAFPM
jgi:hypothetical protein